MIRLGGGAIGGRSGREDERERPLSFASNRVEFLGIPAIVLSCKGT